MIMNSTISHAVNGKQHVMVYTGGGQSVTRLSGSGRQCDAISRHRS